MKKFKFSIQDQLRFNLTVCPDCDITDIPAGYADACESVDQEYGFDDMFIEKCSNTWTDPSDPAEWTTKLGTAALRKFPIANIDFGDASPTTFNTTGSKRKKIGANLYSATYTTYEMAVDSSDCEFFQYLFENQAVLRVFFKDINDFFRLPKEWVEAINASTTIANTPLGFEFSLTSVPQKKRGEGDFVKWEFTLEINRREVFHDVKLPGVPAVLTV